MVQAPKLHTILELEVCLIRHFTYGTSSILGTTPGKPSKTTSRAETQLQRLHSFKKLKGCKSRIAIYPGRLGRQGAVEKSSITARKLLSKPDHFRFTSLTSCSCPRSASLQLLLTWHRDPISARPSWLCENGTWEHFQQVDHICGQED